MDDEIIFYFIYFASLYIGYAIEFDISIEILKLSYKNLFLCSNSKINGVEKYCLLKSYFFIKPC